MHLKINTLTALVILENDEIHIFCSSLTFGCYSSKKNLTNNLSVL